MNCEEFANLGLDLDLSGDAPESAAALDHLRSCASCAALYESSGRLRADLHDLGLATAGAVTPSRVEMRLRQEFRTRHTTDKNRNRAVFASWLLAAATIVLVGGSLFFWQRQKSVTLVEMQPVTQQKVVPAAAGPELGGTLIAENDGHEFALIPGAFPGLQDDSNVVRVQMQRGSLSALGLTVDEEHASDVVQVDLLVGADGQPQAYRLPEATN
jgi:hypothetical protein